MEIKIGDSKYSILADEQAKQDVFDKIIAWMQDKRHYAAHSGEGIMQDDNCTIDAPELISDIIDDILRPSCIED